MMPTKVKRKPIIGLNGPPRCGKTHIMKLLNRMIPHATPIAIQDGLFDLHRERDVAAATYVDYSEYKASPNFDRLGLIATAGWAREKYGEDIFVHMCERTPAYKRASVVLFDNVGFAADNRWAKDRGDPYLLLRIDTEWNLPEPAKADLRRLNANWPGDSRRPFYHTNMLTAYDSMQMEDLLLRVAQGGISESSPYYEYDVLWRKHFA